MAGGAGGVGKIPVVSLSLFKDLLIFSVSSLLLLMFLEANLVGKVDNWVVMRTVDGFSESGSFNLGFILAGLVGAGTGVEGGGEVIEGW